MKLDYCSTHAVGVLVEQDLTCLRIRHDDGQIATPREVWSELERLRSECDRAWREVDTAAANERTRILAAVERVAGRYLREQAEKALADSASTPSSATPR